MRNTEYKVGEEVINIYLFMAYFLNPYHCKKSFTRKIHSVNKDYFSPYGDMEKIDFIAPCNKFARTKKDMDISFEKIISTQEVTPYRTDIFLRTKEDADIIQKCKIYIFEKMETENWKKKKDEIRKLEAKIAKIKREGTSEAEANSRFLAKQNKVFHEKIMKEKQ